MVGPPSTRGCVSTSPKSQTGMVQMETSMTISMEPTHTGKKTKDKVIKKDTKGPKQVAKIKEAFTKLTQVNRILPRQKA